MKNKVAKFTLAATAGFGIFMELGWSFFSMIVRCKRKKGRDSKKIKLHHLEINHPRHRFDNQYEEGKAWCRQQDMQDCYIKSRDGLLLHALYFSIENAKRIILLSHGYKGSGFGDFANIAKFLHENECNLLFIDQRCCGESEGKYITFGAKEQLDVCDWAWYLENHNRKKLPIYLYGTSMGAASVLMASGHELPDNVRGLISDCGFRSMREQLRDMASNWFHVNWIGLLLLRVNIFCAVPGRFRMDDADTSKAMHINRRPVLFFHGSMDTFVDLRNSIYNYSICSAKKELVIVPHARHLCSSYVEPELYRGKLMDFFRKYD